MNTNALDNIFEQLKEIIILLDDDETVIINTTTFHYEVVKGMNILEYDDAILIRDEKGSLDNYIFKNHIVSIECDFNCPL